MTAAVLAMALAAMTGRTLPDVVTQIGHIRTGADPIQNALKAGYRQSSTFRSLVDRLHRAGAIVYIDAGRCRPQVPLPLEGCAVALSSTPAVRYVRVVVDVGGGGDRLIALIGHELQHAVEITASSPARADTREMSPSIEETKAARSCAVDILKELRGQRRSRPRQH